MIEAWWRSLKHQWLFLNSLDSVERVRTLVAFFVDEHNTKRPHAAFRGQTPDEVFFGTAPNLSAERTLPERRSVSCGWPRTGARPAVAARLLPDR
jgi:putative transposase